MPTAAEVRAQLDHPVIDCDGHIREFMPAALPYLRESLGQPAFDRYQREGSALQHSYGGGGTEERRRTRAPQGAWWASPAKNTRDRTTSHTPKLLYERLDELGMDYSVLYPTLAFGTAGLDDEELRRGLVRGYNTFFADVYGPYRDRMTVAGLIPMHTPEEALAELEFCRQAGLKAVSIPHGITRPIPEPLLDNGSPYLWPGQRHWVDTFGLDSDYDYDPVWQRFQDLGFAVTAHGGMTLPVNVYSSITSFTYTHLGSFVQMMYPLAKSLFLGGVTNRFPGLPIAFLECGVSWACALLHDLVEHWEKRSRDGIEWTNPANIDLPEMERLMRAHRGDFPDLEQRFAELIAPLANPVTTPDCLDEWVHVGIEQIGDIRDRFDTFYFGCEADDRTTAFAFSPANEFGAELKVVLSSDIGHWDVSNMDRVMPHAFSMVEQGLLTEEQFAKFCFVNPARLHTGVNPDFFEGTVVADAVRTVRKPAPGAAGQGANVPASTV
jgi:predicted TIM-barrel fold metal-dependent hydrolase